MARVLSYIPGATFGGAHNQACKLAKSLLPYGYEVCVLVPDEPGDAAERLRDNGVETHIAPLLRLRATRSIRVHWKLVRSAREQILSLRRLIRALEIDIVQVHGITCVDGALAAMRNHVPLVWQLIDTRAPLILRAALVPVVDWSGAVVMTTGMKIQGQFPGLNRLADRLVSFYPPVDTEEFVRDPERRLWARRLLGLKEDVPAVICLANMNPQKGLETLLRAAAQLKPVNFDVRIRGSESRAHPGYLGSLRVLSSKLGLREGTIATLEPELSAADFMRAGDVLVLTSSARSEGVPTVLLEAMACGLPVISADVGGASEVVSDQCGALIPPEKDAALVDVLRGMVDWSESKREAVGEAGRIRITQHFSLENCVDAHLEAYRRAAAHVS